MSPSHPAARALDRPLNPLRPGGRWAKLLAALAGGPRDASDLYDAVGEGRPRWRERRKIVRALQAMAGLGWTEATHWGWTRTPQGRDALRAIALAPDAPTPTPEPEPAPCA